MSLRTRLIFAFLFLSVVPLTAVTIFWYASTVHAFERAAERESAETAADIGRRMEMLTANVGRRMDRLFDEAARASDGTSGQDIQNIKVQERLAPMMGDTAALLERVEFHPAAVPAPVPGPLPLPNPEPAPVVRVRPTRPTHGRVPPPPPPPPPGAPGHSGPPPPPPIIVVDVPRMMEEARKAARAGAAAAGMDVGSAIDEAIKTGTPIVESTVSAVANAISREAVTVAGAPRLPMQFKGTQIEVPVRRHGRLVGKANATLKLDVTLQSVLSLARREQGEIPFALDQQGAIYTSDARSRATLEVLGVKEAAAAAHPARHAGWATGSWSRARRQRSDLRHRAPDRRIAAGDPPHVLAQSLDGARGHRAGVHRHRADFTPHDATPDVAQRRRQQARRG